MRIPNVRRRSGADTIPDVHSATATGPPSRPVVPCRAVLLPGSGSDEVFVRAAFQRPLAALGITLRAPAPRPGPGLVTGMLEALDEAAGDGPAIVGGISLGAHVAAGWAAEHPDRCGGLLLAMPGWLGEPGDLPAAVSARVAADAIERDGLPAALAAATAPVAPWLAAELRRAWRRQGAALAPAMRAAAVSGAPTESALAGVTVAAGVAACRDDPVHPARVAERYAAALPCSRLGITTLDELGRSPAALGRTALLAWLTATGQQAG